MAGVCLICCERYNGEEWEGNLVGLKILQRFFELLERHLNDGKRTDHYIKLTKMLVSMGTGGGVGSCESCSKRMESFCEVFYLMKSMELVVNKKMWGLKEFMQCSEQDASKLNCFLEVVKKVEDGEGLLEDEVTLLLSYKRALVKRCSQKLSSTFPQILVGRCQKYQKRKEKGILKGKRSPQSKSTKQPPACDLIDTASVFPPSPPSALLEFETEANEEDSINEPCTELREKPKKLIKIKVEEQEPLAMPSKGILTLKKDDLNEPLEEVSGLECDEDYQLADDHDHDALGSERDTDTSDFSDSDLIDPTSCNTFEEEEEDIKTDAMEEKEAKKKCRIKGKHQNFRNYQIRMFLHKKLLFYKCPNCHLLFSHLHQLLLHRQKGKKGKDNLCHENDQEISVELIFVKWIPKEKRPASTAKGFKFPPSIKIEVAGRLIVHPKLAVSLCTFKNCKKLFYSEEAQAAHLESHNSSSSTATADTYDITAACAFCKYSSIHNRRPDRELQHHYLVQHDVNYDSPVTCQISGCNAYFCRQFYLVKHYKREHGQDDKGVTKLMRSVRRTRCTDCDKSFHMKSKLLQHRLLAHVTNPLRCSIQNCSFICEGDKQLKNHMNLYHKKGKKLNYLGCPTCKKEFRTASFLKNHMKCHEERKQVSFVCEQCGKAFLRKTGYEQHQLHHSGPESWQHVCEICSKRCLSVGKLKEHMRTHSKEKSYVCQVCGAKYAHRHNLRIHVNSKHGDVMEDVPKNYNKANLTSRKGVKRKKQ